LKAARPHLSLWPQHRRGHGARRRCPASFWAQFGAGGRSPRRQPGDLSMSADPAEIHVPPECREIIRAGALVANSTYRERLAM